MQTDGSDRPGARRRNKARPLVFALAAAALLIVLALVLRAVLRTTEPVSRPVTMAPPTEAPASTPPPATAAPGDTAPAVAPPAEELEPETPLPALEHSDPEVRSTLSDILPSIAQPALERDSLVRRSAALGSSFARGKLVRDKLPLPAPGGKPAIVTRGDRTYLAPENSTRYNALVDAVAELDVDSFARWFKRYEPLVNEAWGELGDGTTDARGALIAGLDLMLAAPDIEGDIELVQPSVFYKYADPALESLPDTQKLLIRIGPANRAVVKDKARRLRDALAAQR